MKLKFTLIFLLNFLPFIYLSAQEIRNPDKSEGKNAISYENMFKDISWNTDLEVINERLSVISKALKSSSITKEQNEELVEFKVRMNSFKIRLIDHIVSDPERFLKDPSAEKERVDNLQKQKELAMTEINALK